MFYAAYWLKLGHCSWRLDTLFTSSTTVPPLVLCHHIIVLLNFPTLNCRQESYDSLKLGHYSCALLVWVPAKKVCFIPFNNTSLHSVREKCPGKYDPRSWVNKKWRHVMFSSDSFGVCRHGLKFANPQLCLLTLTAPRAA